MVFIIIIVLSLIATYLLISSGIIPAQDESEKDIELNLYDLSPGMMGSAPSDTIDVYDAKKPISIPMEGAINTLIESFKENANKVFNDFKADRNSVKYKEYIFNDYKLALLRRNESLSEEQLNKYFTIRNTIVTDINNIFTYYLDKIKYDENKSFFTIRREIINQSGTALVLTDQIIGQITNYVMSNTKIPGDIILLIKYKLAKPAQELLDQIVMLAGYNYTTVLETLEQILVREPLPGISILGIVNTSTVENIDSITTIVQGFWTQVYFTFKSNNIDNYLINYIRVSFMNEQIYRAILSTIASHLQKPKITDAINDIIRLCRISHSRMIRTFPYNWTYALINDAIEDDQLMLRNKKYINVDQVDRETSGISNISKYANIQNNFPVSIQNVKSESNSDTITFDYENPFYPILSDEYMVNNYLSFPSIKHRGVYFDRTNAVASADSGYILISNTSTLRELTIAGLMIYAVVQSGLISSDYKNIYDTVEDVNIVNNNAIITIEYGKLVGNVFTQDIDSIINTQWLLGQTITVDPEKCIRIRATKQINTVGDKYLRIYAFIIPFVSKPISDFLKITVVADRQISSDAQTNHFRFENIPIQMPNILVTFDSSYKFRSATAVADTYSILTANLTQQHNRFIVTGANGDIITGNLAPNLQSTTLSATPVAGAEAAADAAAAAGGAGAAAAAAAGVSIGTQGSYLNVKSEIGLIMDRFTLYADDVNKRSTYRLKFKNTGIDSIRIKKLMVFGSTEPSLDNFGTLVPISGFLTDDSLLPRNTVITSYKMNPTETLITETNDNRFIIDSINQVAESTYYIQSNDSVYIEPVVTSIANRYRTDRYVCIRAIYIEVDGSDLSTLSFSIIDLAKSKIATMPASTLWNNKAALIILNPIGDGAATYSHFSILPSMDHFRILPEYSDKFQSDYYEQYYNPVSEIVQYPTNSY